ncbi:Thioredoxin [uncultured archaeon]|nr:Thioredoxin [uncultured archaeon]
MEHETHTEHKHMKKNFKFGVWQISTIILGVVTILLVAMIFTGKTTGNVISGETAGKQLTEYLNKQTQGGVDYVSNLDKGNLYEIKVKYQGQEIPVYTTKDGKYFIQSAADMTASPSANTNANSQEPVKEVVKSDKPKVELFVMTHCPYGTQAEKGFIPTLKALGNKVDAKVRFVHYFMHGDKEEKETYNQVCIREEQSSKYFDYLTCFLASTGNEDDAKKCLDTAKIDKTKLTACLSNDYKKAKEYYEIDKKLSNQYGVQGSPTLVINGAQINSGRSAEALKTSICSGFNTSPSECSQKLSTDNPGPGFGTASSSGGSSPSASGGGCATA